jgi:hypothetical protein
MHSRGWGGGVQRVAGVLRVPFPSPSHRAADLSADVARTSVLLLLWAHPVSLGMGINWSRACATAANYSNSYRLTNVYSYGGATVSCVLKYISFYNQRTCKQSVGTIDVFDACFEF